MSEAERRERVLGDFATFFGEEARTTTEFFDTQLAGRGVEPRRPGRRARPGDAAARTARRCATRSGASTGRGRRPRPTGTATWTAPCARASARRRRCWRREARHRRGARRARARRARRARRTRATAGTRRSSRSSPPPASPRTPTSRRTGASTRAPTRTRTATRSPRASSSTTATGRSLRSWTVRGQRLDQAHGVQVATSDGAGRLVLLDKSPPRALLLDRAHRRADGRTRRSPRARSPTTARGARTARSTSPTTREAVLWRVPPGGGKPERVAARTRGSTAASSGRPASSWAPTSGRCSSPCSPRPVGRRRANPSTGRLFTIAAPARRLAGPADPAVGEPARGRAGRLRHREVGRDLHVAARVEPARGHRGERDGARALPRRCPAAATTAARCRSTRRRTSSFLGTRLMVANQAFVSGDKTHHAILDVEAGEEGLPELIPPAPQRRHAARRRRRSRRRRSAGRASRYRTAKKRRVVPPDAREAARGGPQARLTTPGLRLGSAPWRVPTARGHGCGMNFRPFLFLAPDPRRRPRSRRRASAATLLRPHVGRLRGRHARQGRRPPAGARRRRRQRRGRRRQDRAGHLHRHRSPTAARAPLQIVGAGTDTTIAGPDGAAGVVLDDAAAPTSRGCASGCRPRRPSTGIARRGRQRAHRRHGRRRRDPGVGAPASACSSGGDASRRAPPSSSQRRARTTPGVDGRRPPSRRVIDSSLSAQRACAARRRARARRSCAARRSTRTAAARPTARASRPRTSSCSGRSPTGRPARACARAAARPASCGDHLTVVGAAPARAASPTATTPA